MLLFLLACTGNADLLGQCDATAIAIADTDAVGDVSLQDAQTLLAAPFSYDVVWSPQLIASLPADVPAVDVLDVSLAVVQGTATRRTYPGGGCKPREDALGFAAEITLTSQAGVVSTVERVLFELPVLDLADVGQLESADAELLPSIVDATMEARDRPGEVYEGATVWVTEGLAAPEIVLGVQASWGNASAMSGAGTRREEE